ncbi:TnsA-like heteromeric transposase endonuclease subunit [Micromonospora sp. NPDC093277]|uniref:TnsA-like heteromeric transposase endonuclease subunit n=1 Tax=Micromonospora sp. NPDC093277 TaxID=3364291 RepID=UPI0038147684
MDGFEVGYVAEDGTQHRLPLTAVWTVRFEATAPVRRFTARKEQRHLPGRWWSATDGAHVGYESWLERNHVMALDFEPAVVGIASQPFWLSWRTPEGPVRSHAPDYFARRSDGSAMVVDCRPAERRPARDLAAFEATRRACELLDWEYRLVGAPDAIVTANLRWLAGYRHPREDAAKRWGLRALAEAPV